MKKLFKKLCWYIVLLIAGLVLVFCIPCPYTHSLSTMINKCDLMRKSSHFKERRIVILGGSGAWAGVDSPQFKKALGYEPVNLGFYIGFGIDFFIRSLVPKLRKGDVILAIPEYRMLFTSCRNTAVGRKWLLAADPYNAIRLIYSRPGTAPKLLMDIAALDQDKILGAFQILFDKKPRHKKVVRGYYRFSDFNNLYGDCLGELFNTVPTEQISGYQEMFSQNDFDGRIIPLLNEAGLAAQKAGAWIFFSWPVYPRAELERNRVAINAIEEKLKNIPGLKILGTPEDFAFEYTAFTNSVYHITTQARQERTALLVKYVQQELTKAR